MVSKHKDTPFKQLDELATQSSDNNQLSIGSMGRGVAGRSFSLKAFNEDYAQGYIKLCQSNEGLYIKVIDTYGLETEEEHREYLENGYIRVGYPERKDDKSNFKDLDTSFVDHSVDSNDELNVQQTASSYEIDLARLDEKTAIIKKNIHKKRKEKAFKKNEKDLFKETKKLKRYQIKTNRLMKLNPMSRVIRFYSYFYTVMFSIFFCVGFLLISGFQPHLNLKDSFNTLLSPFTLKVLFGLSTIVTVYLNGQWSRSFKESIKTGSYYVDELKGQIETVNSLESKIAYLSKNDEYQKKK